MTHGRAIVIGSGFGGLAAAIRMQALGFDTTILEKREKVGGRAYQLKDKGYTFDMGPSLITAPSIIDDVFRTAGRKREDYLDWQALDPYYRIYFHDGSSIDYSSNPDEMKRQMAQINPKDAANYDKFMKRIEPIYHAVITEKLGARPFDKLKANLAFVPKIIKLNAWMPVYTYVKRYFKDFRHRFLFSFHPLFIGGNPFVAPSVYLMIPFLEKMEGVLYAKGGMYTLVQSLQRVFEEQGGTILTNHEVQKIDVDQGKVRGVVANQQVFPADLVISNADVGHTYSKLIAPEHRKKWTDRRVDRTKYAMSAFLIYVGVKKKYENLKHHTIILAKRYKGLINDIFKRYVLPEDFSMYLHVPSRTDPDMAPPGCESIYILAPVTNLKSQIDWEAIQEGFTDTILNFLEKWGLPDLQANIETKHVFTPQNFATTLNSYHGNAFGIEPKLTQTALLRPHNHSEDVQNLFFVGAGTHPGAGVPGVLLGAEATEYCVIRDVLKEDPEAFLRKRDSWRSNASSSGSDRISA